MNVIRFYGLPNCTTCQKALRRLEYHRVPDVEKRNIKEEPLTREEIEKLAAMLGGVENLFSRRSVKYRELGLRDKELSETDMLDLMENEYTFLKRPIIVAGSRAVAGFFERIYDDFLTAETQNNRPNQNR